MAVPTTARVAAAMDALGAELPADAARLLVYRLLRVELARQRGLRAPVPGGTGSQEALELLRVVDGADPGADDVGALARLHQELLAPGDRRGAGVYFTPAWLVEHLLDQALEPTLDEHPPDQVRVCDPSCGSGLFLVAVARRLRRRGVPWSAVLERVHGIDIDPGAAELARLGLWLTALDEGDSPDLPDPAVHVGDALDGEPPGAPYDVVVGNPPFLNRLERRTAPDRDVGRRWTEQSRGALRGYTDVSAVFLHRATTWLRPGGRVALVQPQSLLAARDAAGVRRHLAEAGALESLWAGERPVFDAGVLTCAPVVRLGGDQGPVSTFHGETAEPGGRVDPGDLSGTWSHLVAAALGIPVVRLETGAAGVVGDVAVCTADFRDQYYGLRPHVREAGDCPDGVPLVTTGLIDPARSLWGRRPTRFLKQQWRAPVVDPGSLVADDALARWAASRRVPKVLVATQGQVVEAVADEAGDWLPSVPTLTVVPRTASVWHLLAVLLAPPVSAHAATTYAGAGLSMRAVKLSAKQVALLPLPAEGEEWDRAADLVREAQRAPTDEGRLARLESMGVLMCAAYDVEPERVLPWWRERLR